MDSTEETRSALDQIKDVNFRTGMRGYVVDEVDEFLDQAAVEVDQLREQMHQLRQQLRQASERIVQLQNGASGPLAAPAPAPAPVTAIRPAGGGAEQVTAMIAMAQQFIDQAQNEAAEKAREMTTTAQERAREIINEARSRAEDEVQRLNGLKQRLSEDVDALSRQLDGERLRVSKVLSELHQWIEDSLHVNVTRGTVAPAPVPAPAAEAATPAPAVAEPTSIFSAPRPAAPPPAPSRTIGDVVDMSGEENR